MKRIITKELLSEVLFDGKYNLYVDETVGDGNTLLVNDIEELEISEFISIYELVNKCKEWAYEKGYFIETKYNNISVYNYNSDTYETSIICTYFIDVLEYEIKACQWILENK